jgi:delta-aminolevulinic acid dehydratase/porphobilinogen synthase
VVQPYSKKTLGVKDIAVFPWEKEEPTRQDAQPAMSTEEIMAKYREALKQYGFK